MARSSSCRSPGFASPRSSASSADEVDEMWRSVLQRFPQHPHWCLVKEKRCIYRMGSQAGRKILCRVSHGGLQVRVGGGWMTALAFLERHGPTSMGPRPGEEHFPSHSGSHHQGVDMPASMERLLVPTKSWASRIGISTTPDLREQRRLPKEVQQLDVETGASSSGRLKRPAAAWSPSASLPPPGASSDGEDLAPLPQP
ncbi:unnamed protein product [Polarella glacialis]|uniref:GAR domain-containing protein n=1 Tax=Polarella glacialis TaxID=89957 RepID=A0A813GQE3_POLGL|nr:unnamed protein product [Polarella glacialis]